MLMAHFGKKLHLSAAAERSDRETKYDTLSLSMLCEDLRTFFPHDGLMGEGLKNLPPSPGMEFNDREIFPGTSGRIWVIDPICGSIPFSCGIPDYIISLACVETEPFTILCGIVYFPPLDQLYYAESGIGSYLNGQRITVSNLTTAEELKRTGIISIEHKIIREQGTSIRAISLSRIVARLRVAGTCGLELAYTADGKLVAALKARQPLYDYAAGLLILKEAGGKVTDFDGREPKIELSNQKVTDILASNGHIHEIILNEFAALSLKKAG